MSHHIFFASFLVPPYTVTTSDISPVRACGRAFVRWIISIRI